MAQPKYISLAAELRKEVLSGKYGSEGGIPAVRDLAQRHAVTANTVTAALHLLVHEGLLIKRNQYFYVNHIEVTMTRYVPLPAVRLQPRQGYVKTISVSMGRLPEHFMRKINFTEARDVPIRNQIAGEMNGEERPLQLSTRYYFLPLSEAQLGRLTQDSGWDPMWEIQRILQSRDEISSRPATDREAEQLSLPIGTSIIAVWEVIRDPDGTLLMAQELTLSPRETLIFEFAFENKPSEREVA